MSRPGELFAEGLAGIGFEPPVMCNVSPEVFAEFLAQQTAKNLPKEQLPEVIPHGTTRINRPRRIPKSKDWHVLLDPCAGDGEAIATLRDLWFGETRTYKRYETLNAHVIAIELEKQRFAAAKKRFTFWDQSRNQPWDQILEADAFHLAFKPNDGASVLFLNPPYDTDKVYGRLSLYYLHQVL